MTDTTDIATPRQAERMNLGQAQRIKDQYEAMLCKLEKLDAPTDYVGVERALKAIGTADKVRRGLYAPERTEKKTVKTTKPAQDDQPAEEAEFHDDTDATTGGDIHGGWRAIVQRRLVALADAEETGSVSEQPERDGGLVSGGGMGGGLGRPEAAAA